MGVASHDIPLSNTAVNVLQDEHRSLNKNYRITCYIS